MNYILIDGSYYTFYRLFALINWWKLSHQDEPCENLHGDPEFIQKFKQIFVSKLLEIPKKLKLNKEIPVKFIVSLDCRRCNIWRNDIYPDYKSTRSDYSDASNKPGPFFQMVYDEQLFQNIPNIDISVIQHPKLEADDCLAITSKYLASKYDNRNIYIITSDTDYLQLIQNNIHLYNLKFKTVNTTKNSFNDPQKDLLYKIIIGDKSDNIPSVFPKCGPKKTQMYMNNPEIFKQDLDKFNAHNKYQMNCTLIDFNNIPNELQKPIIEWCHSNI